jgi:hypothetical protein
MMCMALFFPVHARPTSDLSPLLPVSIALTRLQVEICYGSSFISDDLIEFSTPVSGVSGVWGSGVAEEHCIGS